VENIRGRLENKLAELARWEAVSRDTEFEGAET